MNTSPSPSAQPEFIAARHAALDAARMAELKAANINPRTGLATDYLNHFNEAVMLLEMIPDIPECAEDFLQWRPLSYAEHFTASNFTARDLAISAYEAADVGLRAEFDPAAGQRIEALGRRSCAPHQENFVVAKDGRADRELRT